MKMKKIYLYRNTIGIKLDKYDIAKKWKKVIRFIS